MSKEFDALNIQGGKRVPDITVSASEQRTGALAAGTYSAFCGTVCTIGVFGVDQAGSLLTTGNGFVLEANQYQFIVVPFTPAGTEIRVIGTAGILHLFGPL